MDSVVKTGYIDTTKAEKSILEVLAYFDIFQYPLTEKEIKKLLSQQVAEEKYKAALESLISDKIIFRLDRFYSLRDDSQLATRRREGNYRAKTLFIKAVKIGAFLYKFPYVRAVALSGSLSKDYVDEKADIDFFIITKANRLWIARTIMHLFKKFTFLSGRQHLYCMNYYIDEEALVIEEKNIYTATEIITLLPLGGSACMKNFFEANNWASEWFPMYFNEHELSISDTRSPIGKFAEWLLNKRMGDRLDQFLFKWTSRRWEKKEQRGQKNMKGKTMSLITGRHFAKSDPESFQEKIIVMYNTRINELKDQWPQFFE